MTRWRSLPIAAATLTIATLAGAGPVGVAGGILTAGAAGSHWTVYHNDLLGSGVDTSGVSFGAPTTAWTSTSLDGQLFGEPLEATGMVYVATQNDTVYALSAHDGSVVWSTHLGTPVPAGDLPCGDISPMVGITGTPVLDVARSEIFVVADELAGSTPVHQLIGLNMFTGAVVLDESAEPPGSTPAALLQRTGLTLDNGNVVFGYGGNDGDCSTYHGWVVSAPENGSPIGFFGFDAGVGQREGAVWMGGAAPVVDGAGNIWVATGNGSATSGPYDGSDSVTELTAALARVQFFAPSDWATQNANDGDLGSTAPALVSNGTVLQVGKSQTGYLLSQASLGGVGGDLASTGVCPGATADGGDAISGSVVYVPCQNGVEAISTSAAPAGLSVAWRAASGAGGPPIVAGGYVWSIGGGSLDAMDPSSGATVHQFAVGAEANHFPTPSVGDGLLLAPESNRVLALAGSLGVPPGPTPPPPLPPNSSYWLVASDGGVFSFGNAAFHGSMGGQFLNQPVIGMAGTEDKGGYWLLARDGGIFAFGDAGFHGSMGGQPLNAPMVGIAPTPDGGGYWTVAADGGVFSFGDARFLGSMGGRPLHAPIVGMAVAPGGGGYWLVASDGGIFAFGSARFSGSMGGTPLNRPVVGMAADPVTGGYWLTAGDGGIFAFDAPFLGSTGSIALRRPVVAMTAVGDGGGYWFAAADGGVFAFGDARFSGSLGGLPLGAPVVGMASA